MHNFLAAQAPPAPPPMQGGPGPSTNPYDFILNEKPKPKRSLLPGGNSKMNRIVIVVAIVSVILILGIILFAALNGASSAGTDDMIIAVQEQQEIARISDIAAQKARQSETKNIAISSAETMRSDQATLVAYLKKNGKKLSSKEMAAGKNGQTDAALTQAEQINHFDATFGTTLAKNVFDYQKTLKNAHDHTTSASGKKLLERMYTNAATIADKLQKLNASTSS